MQLEKIDCPEEAPEDTRFARTIQLIGTDEMEKLKNARIAVCGLGAVGSYAVEALARSGVGFLRIVDFDTVDTVNINRQLYALDSTVGKAKVAVAEERVRDINPHCNIDPRRTFINEDTIPELLDDGIDVVVDAIDSVNCKVNLLVGSYQRKIHTVSSMGAAARMDVDSVRTSDIFESYNCPLARMIRRRLHRRGVEGGIRCVFSPEPASNKRPPVIQEEIKQDGGRIRMPLGSISFVTGIFGLKAASEAVRYILDR